MGNDCFAPRFTFSLTALLEKVAPVTPSTCAVYHVSAIALLAHHVVIGKFAFGNHCARHAHHEEGGKQEYFLFHLVDTNFIICYCRKEFISFQRAKLHNYRDIDKSEW